MWVKGSVHLNHKKKKTNTLLETNYLWYSQMEKCFQFIMKNKLRYAVILWDAIRLNFYLELSLNSTMKNHVYVMLFVNALMDLSMFCIFDIHRDGTSHFRWSDLLNISPRRTVNCGLSLAGWQATSECMAEAAENRNHLEEELCDKRGNHK